MLHLDWSSIHKTYYDILFVKEDASYDEIRANYKTAVLNLHPDKQNPGNGEIPCTSTRHERFLEVQKAWEVLSNSKSRIIYDRELSASKLDLVYADEVRLREMKLENTGDTLDLLHPCRCGDTFAISSSELAEMGFSLDKNGSLELQDSNMEPVSIVIPCCSCSLKINLVVHAGP